MPTTRTEPQLEFAHVVLVNDEHTSADLVIQLLRLVFGKSEREARELTNLASWLGRKSCGVYALGVARALVTGAAAFAAENGKQVKFDIELVGDPDAAGTPRCSFCGKVESAVRRLFSGKDAFVCDECVLDSASSLSSEITTQQFNFIHELLDWHFGGCPKENIVSSNRTFPQRMRADLQRAAEASFAASALKVTGIHGGYGYEQVTIASLLHVSRDGKRVGPLRYQDVDVGDDEPVKCLENALWLLKEGDVPYIVLLINQQDMHGASHINVEIASPAGEAGRLLGEQHFRSLELAVSQATSYRGKVLSLEQGDRYSGMVGGIQVHRLANVARADVVLPEATLILLERNVIQFARKRTALKALGQSGKKGLLFHGPPGTGKTHTVRYLASALPGHTTLLITAEQIGLLHEYFTLARLLQPAILVIEDADLIARDRGHMDSACEEIMLNQLLNEMDGLTADAEIFFILTTNRPEMLEAALASRPGRIDQAIEFPVPDELGRRKLIALYGRGLKFDDSTLDGIISKTKGVSAAFIKELMRRTAQYNLERDGGGAVLEADASAAMEEMLFSGGKLNRALLGSEQSGNA